MSELELVQDDKPVKSHSAVVRRLFHSHDIGFYLMVIMAWAASVYTSYDVGRSQLIWRWLIPLFGIICIFTQWHKVEPTPKGRLLLILHQVLHWGVMTALAFLLIMSSTGQYGLTNIFDSRQVGFIISIMLAFSTYLAGLYHDWRLCIVAAFIFIGGIINVAFSNLAPLLLWVGLGILALYLLWAWLYGLWQERNAPEVTPS